MAENNEIETLDNVDNESVIYLNSVHRSGFVWGFVILGLVLLFPILLSIFFGAMPNFEVIWKGLLATIPVYWTVGVIEIFTYVPMLGAGGSYLSFITGNISNLKLPCALDAMDRAGFKSNTEEGELISTISIAVSSIVTTAIIILGVILIIPLSPILESPVLTPAFDQLLPALFGGLAVVFISKNWKISIIPLVIMLVLFIFVPALDSSTVGIMVPVGVIITLIEARIMYKKGML